MNLPKGKLSTLSFVKESEVVSSCEGKPPVKFCASALLTLNFVHSPVSGKNR